MKLHELISAQNAEAIAIVDHAGAEVTYGVLNAGARDLAAEFRLRGVVAGDRVALVAENAIDALVGLFAASLCGAWAMPVNARMSAVELAALFAHARPRLALFTAGVSEAARAHAEVAGAEEVALGALGSTWVAMPFASEPEPGPADVAALLYTTGTTSDPKGVMLTHGNLTTNAFGSAALNGLKAGDDILAALPITHVFGLGSMSLPALAKGAKLRLLPRFDPGEVIGHLRRRTTYFPGVPAMFARIIAALDEPLDAPALRRISAGGAPLDPELKARVEAGFGLTLNNGYGMTECSPTISATREGERQDGASCGPPLPHVKIRVAAPNLDGIGGLEIAGPTLMAGYYKAPEATEAAMTEDGYFRTGDLGRIDADGNVYVVGRQKELIIRGGFNVYPPEVEAMLVKHPNISQAAVVGRAVQGDEEICAFVIPNGDIAPRDLKAWLRDRLAAYKLPQRIVVAPTLPAAATGKVLKHRLLGHFVEELKTAGV